MARLLAEAQTPLRPLEVPAAVLVDELLSPYKKGFLSSVSDIMVNRKQFKQIFPDRKSLLKLNSGVNPER